MKRKRKQPYAMTRSTCNILNPQVLSARANRDAVISSSNCGFEDGHITGELNVDAISVRAVSISHQLHSMHFHVLASIDQYVKQLTINRSQPSDHNVLRVSQSKCLLLHNKKNYKFFSQILYQIKGLTDTNSRECLFAQTFVIYFGDTTTLIYDRVCRVVSCVCM